MAAEYLSVQVDASVGSLHEVMHSNDTASDAKIAVLLMGIEGKLLEQAHDVMARVGRDFRDVSRMLDQAEIVKYRLLMVPFGCPSRMAEVPESEQLAVRVWFQDVGAMGDGEWNEEHVYYAETAARYMVMPGRVTEVWLRKLLMSAGCIVADAASTIVISSSVCQLC